MSSSPSSRAATPYSSFNVVANIGGSSLLMRDPDTGLDHGDDRVLAQVGHRAGGHVGGRADLDRDLVRGQVGEQLRILDRGGAVTDPLGAELADGVPDRLRSGGLAGVRDAVQAGGPGRVEVRLELRSRYADLGATESEAHQARRAVIEGDPQRAVGALQAQLAGDVEDPAQHDAEVALGGHPSVLDGLDELLGRDATHDRGVRRDGQLGVPDVLRRHLGRDLVRQQPHVLAGPDQVDDRQVDLDEVGEVAEPEVVGQLLGIGRHGPGVTLGQPGHDRGRRRPDVVHVQLGLRQPGDEGPAGIGQRGQDGVGRHGPQSGNAPTAALLCRYPPQVWSLLLNIGLGQREAGRRRLPLGQPTQGQQHRFDQDGAQHDVAHGGTRRVRRQPGDLGSGDLHHRVGVRVHPVRLDHEAGVVQRGQGDGQAAQGIVDPAPGRPGPTASAQASQPQRRNRATAGARSTSSGRSGATAWCAVPSRSRVSPVGSVDVPEDVLGRGQGETADADQGADQAQPLDVRVVVLGLVRRRPHAVGHAVPRADRT